MKEICRARIPILLAILATLMLLPAVFMILFRVDFDHLGLFYIYVAPALMFLGLLYFKAEWIMVGVPVLAALLGICWAMLATRRFLVFLVPLSIPILVYCFVGFLAWALRNG